MTPMNKRLLLIVAIALAVAGAYGVWALVSARDTTPPVLVQPDTGDTDGSGSSADTSRTPGSPDAATADDHVPDDAAYEIIDALRNAGIAPVMGSDLELVYVDRLDTVKVSGSFEGTKTASFTLRYVSGAWKVGE